MDGEPPFLENPDGTREEIMRATYRALCEHGYADLTVQRIGDHFEKSVSLLYQHYDGKDDLLLAFLSFMLDAFERSIPDVSEGTPTDHLDAVLTRALDPAPPDAHEEFDAAMVELRSQAAHDARYRDQFTRHDRFFRDRLEAVVRAGVDDGTFRDADPERVVSFVFSLLEGARTLRVTSDASDPEAVRAEVDAYLETALYD